MLFFEELRSYIAARDTLPVSTHKIVSGASKSTSSVSSKSVTGDQGQAMLYEYTMEEWTRWTYENSEYD